MHALHFHFARNCLCWKDIPCPWGSLLVLYSARIVVISRCQSCHSTLSQHAITSLTLHPCILIHPPATWGDIFQVASRPDFLTHASLAAFCDQCIWAKILMVVLSKLSKSSQKELYMIVTFLNSEKKYFWNLTFMNFLCVEFYRSLYQTIFSMIFHRFLWHNLKISINSSHSSIISCPLPSHHYHYSSV